MKMEIIADTKDYIRWQRKFIELQRTFPVEAIEATSDIADVAVGTLKTFIIPHNFTGELTGSIKKIPTEDGYNVVAKAYLHGLDKGHRLDEVTQKLVRWAKQKHGKKYPWVIGSMMKRGYTNPHPIIEPTKRVIRSQIPLIAEKKMKEAIQVMR